jgi:hypothetical protein
MLLAIKIVLVAFFIFLILAALGWCIAVLKFKWDLRKLKKSIPNNLDEILKAAKLLQGGVLNVRDERAKQTIETNKQKQRTVNYEGERYEFEQDATKSTESTGNAELPSGTNGTESVVETTTEPGKPEETDGERDELQNNDVADVRSVKKRIALHSLDD